MPALDVDDYFIEVSRKAEVFLYLGRGFETSIEHAGAEQADADAAINDLREWFNKQLGSLGVHSELDARLQRYLHLTQV